MTKVIVLEKDIDGVYRATKPEKQILKKRIKNRKLIINNEELIIPNEVIHKFIAENGTKVSEFLSGIEKTTKAFNILIKIMKS